ncbi:tubby C-terminal-like domain-containing protein [Pelagophyceae sp. CCMP2097]|nr:tubby C-terminal-like domain-containing protein [Pelagophyceae sp. CCMP2097]
MLFVLSLFAALDGAGAMVWGDFGQTILKAAKSASPHALGPPTRATSGFVVREQLFSMSGEDFVIQTEEGADAFQIVGSNKVPFGLGGLVLDRLELYSAQPRDKLCSVERRAVALATAYDIYDSEGKECIAKIERDIVSLTPSYKFFYEAEQSGDPFYRAVGSFSERKFDIYARDGTEIATVGRQLFEISDRMDNYYVRCASGVDAAAIIALVVCIDEDHDESDESKRKKAEERGEDQGGGFPWPF